MSFYKLPLIAFFSVNFKLDYAFILKGFDQSAVAVGGNQAGI